MNKKQEQVLSIAVGFLVVTGFIFQVMQTSKLLKNVGKVVNYVSQDRVDNLGRWQNGYDEGFDDGINHTIELTTGEVVSYCEFINFHAYSSKYKLVLKEDDSLHN